jgi:hypothetical protein
VNRGWITLRASRVLPVRGRGRQVCRCSPFWRASCAASATSNGAATADRIIQDHLPTSHDSGGVDDPERACAAAEALAAIQRLFTSDEAALKVITGLISGMAAEDIRRHYGLTAVQYDTTRRRIRRTMLRHGLAWSWP